uniref:Uncharacterized protein n=1 Tax=Elaeophora elaphi TaxID=1147741 RepID=A0A0R3RJF1_9BILA
MARNFNMEASALMILTYITLIIIILRIALSLCQYTIKNKIDRAKRMRKRFLSPDKVIVIKADENRQNPMKKISDEQNEHKYHERLAEKHNSSYYQKYQMSSCNSSEKSKSIHAPAKIVYPSMKQPYQKEINDDESFWLHSSQESEQSKDNATVPHTSAYGMRKIGKKKYIE